MGESRGLAGPGAQALRREAAGTGHCAACGRIAREKCGQCLKVRASVCLLSAEAGRGEGVKALGGMFVASGGGGGR